MAPSVKGVLLRVALSGFLLAALPALAADSPATPSRAARAALNTSPPASPVKLVFIHHSTGENWLADGNGDLGTALRDNSYFVSDTNYGWGPADADAGSATIGDHTDIGNWYSWFAGPNRETYMAALFAESGQHASYARLSSDPGGSNQIVMLKSCFPNSQLGGSPSDPIPSIDSNPLRNQDSGSEHHTLANAKGIYVEILKTFALRRDKLFIVVTAPPLVPDATDETAAANARALNDWLVNGWLASYPYKNVFVFDFFNVLTSNGGSSRTNNPDVNDLGWADGNHHRVSSGAVQHLRTIANNMSAYGTGDSHPSQAGNQKATGEFVQLLNVAYHCFVGDGGCPTGTTNGTPAYSYFIPAVSHAPGAAGSLWRSDVAAVSLSASPSRVTLTFYPTGGSPVSQTLTLDSQCTVEWSDVLASVFGTASSGAASGALRVDSEQALLLSSRTFNQGSTGTYGAYLPAFTAAQALQPGRMGYLAQLKRSSAFRTNVGVMNPGTISVQVAVRLNDANGNLAGVEKLMTVPPGGMVQENDIFGTTGAGDHSIAFASLEVRTPGGLAWAYASVIDNATGDPTIVPMLVP